MCVWILPLATPNQPTAAGSLPLWRMDSFQDVRQTDKQTDRLWKNVVSRNNNHHNNNNNDEDEFDDDYDTTTTMS